MENVVNTIRGRLENLAEENYKAFNKKLLPGVKDVLGVRVPVLRSLAKEIAKGDFRGWLKEAETQITESSCHEEILLQGLVIGYAKMEKEERTAFLDAFVPKISNWAICDTCTMHMKFMQKEPDYWYDYIMKYRTSIEEFELRFLLVALLAHYTDEKYLNEIFCICNEIRHEGYYVKMATAWLVSVCYVKFPKQTSHFLEKNEMDDFTHNKSIQKIRESYRVSQEEKEWLNSMKRKNNLKKI